MNEIVAHSIRVFRAIQHISQTDLAELATANGFKMSRGTVARIELADKEITISDIEALCSVFRITPAQLLSENFGSR